MVLSGHQGEGCVQDRIDERVPDAPEPRPDDAHDPEPDAEAGDVEQPGSFMRAGSGCECAVVDFGLRSSARGLPLTGIHRRIQQMAPCGMAVVRDHDPRRLPTPADSHRLHAARGEHAAGRLVVQIGNVARNHGQLARSGALPRRIAFQKRTGVGMRGLMEDRAHRAGLDHLARVHHHYLVAELGDQAEIVRDHHDRRLQLAPELADQVDDLRLHGDVQRRRGLVGDEEHRVHQQRHGDTGALAHPAAELVRILRDAALGIGNADPLHHLDGAGALVGHAQAGPPVEDVGHLPGVGQHRRLRGHRVLEHHRDLLAPHVHHGGLAQPEHVPAVEDRGAALDDRIGGEQPGEGPDHGALARAALADDADDLAPGNGERHVAQGMHAPARGAEVHAQVANVEQWLHASPLLVQPGAEDVAQRGPAPARSMEVEAGEVEAEDADVG